MSLEILGGGLAEILGSDDLNLLMGDDDEMLGAAVRKAIQRNPSAAAAVARKPLGVSDAGFTKGRQLVIGFDSVAAVAAAATVAINSNPQQVFAPERICVPATIAPNFNINSLTIGTAIQFLNATAVHAEVFGSTAPDVRLKMDTAQINSVISFNVTNLSAAAVRFHSALIGPSVM